MEVFNLSEQKEKVKIDADVGIGISKFISAENISAGTAVIDEGKQVNAHYHEQGEEVYLITEGEGQMYLGKPNTQGVVEWDAPVKVNEGDCFLVPRGRAHSLRNSGSGRLVIAFFSAPPFSAGGGSDRVLVENPKK
ncbi:cupin domain-containing protein [Candidatus Micrarchaeota archaeon]|nr:cupin domain-containing protein [Candidatus Micrarchaeota archaeon]